MARRFGRVFSFIKDVFGEFNRDRGTLFAAAIAFYALISLIPLFLLAIGVFGYIIGSREAALSEILNLAQNYIPAGGAAFLERNIRAIIAQSGILSGIGVVGLLWAGMQVFVTLEAVMNIAVGVEERQGFLISRGRALVTVIVAGLLLALSIGITSFLTVIRDFRIEIWGISHNGFGIVWPALVTLASITVTILAFVLTYKFLPAKDIGVNGPLIGGITAGLLFDIAKYVFRWYVSHFAIYSRIYGALGGVIILIVWIYYTSIITVLGAEVASVYAQREGR